MTENITVVTVVLIQLQQNHWKNWQLDCICHSQFFFIFPNKNNMILLSRFFLVLCRKDGLPIASVFSCVSFLDLATVTFLLCVFSLFFFLIESNPCSTGITNHYFCLCNIPCNYLWILAGYYFLFKGLFTKVEHVTLHFTVSEKCNVWAGLKI